MGGGRVTTHGAPYAESGSGSSYALFRNLTRGARLSHRRRNFLVNAHRMGRSRPLPSRYMKRPRIGSYTGPAASRIGVLVVVAKEYRPICARPEYPGFSAARCSWACRLSIHRNWRGSISPSRDVAIPMGPIRFIGGRFRNNPERYPARPSSPVAELRAGAMGKITKPWGKHSYYYGAGVRKSRYQLDGAKFVIAISELPRPLGGDCADPLPFRGAGRGGVGGGAG